MIIDGKNAVLGRLAAYVAKELLKGEKIEIMNAEKIIILGNPKKIVTDCLERRRRGSPKKGPFFPRKPDLIVKRAIRGMLPYKTDRGKQAMKNLKVHIGEIEATDVKTVAVKNVKTNFISIEKLSKNLGWDK